MTSLMAAPLLFPYPLDPLKHARTRTRHIQLNSKLGYPADDKGQHWARFSITMYFQRTVSLRQGLTWNSFRRAGHSTVSPWGVLFAPVRPSNTACNLLGPAGTGRQAGLLLGGHSVPGNLPHGGSERDLLWWRKGEYSTHGSVFHLQYLFGDPITVSHRIFEFCACSQRQVRLRWNALCTCLIVTDFYLQAFWRAHVTLMSAGSPLMCRSVIWSLAPGLTVAGWLTCRCSRLIFPTTSQMENGI